MRPEPSADREEEFDRAGRRVTHDVQPIETGPAADLEDRRSEKGEIGEGGDAIGGEEDRTRIPRRHERVRRVVRAFAGGLRLRPGRRGRRADLGRREPRAAGAPGRGGRRRRPPNGALGVRRERTGRPGTGGPPPAGPVPALRSGQHGRGRLAPRPRFSLGGHRNDGTGCSRDGPRSVRAARSVDEVFSSAGFRGASQPR